MLKRNITYEDFNGDTVTEEFYFNLSELDLIELEVEREGGIAEFFTKLVKEDNRAAMISEFKKLLLLSYGIKSEDGKQFVKTPEIREAFSHSAAFITLFFEVTKSEDAMVQFMLATFPKSMVKAFQAAQVQDKPTGPPKPPIARR